MTRLLIATHNPHKTVEFRALLEARFEVLDMSAVPLLEPPEETGQTFEENARIKALHGAAAFDGLVLADDSGLEVDALGGAPGVLSARYAGPEASDAANVQKLLCALKGQPRPWTARFRCALAWARGEICLGTVTGTLEGEILPEQKGFEGFGYDPVFRPTGSALTLAELSQTEKNRISHRSVAARTWLQIF